VKGRYLFATSGTNFPPAATQQQLFARAGYRIFNGDGTGTILWKPQMLNPSKLFPVGLYLLVGFRLYHFLQKS
jgi:hypothetical protein